MKTYTKKEIKNIFDSNVNEVFVSGKLKKQTFIKINSATKHTFFWLSNCAAILVVSLICLFLYTNRSIPNTTTKLNRATSQSVLPQDTIELNSSEFLQEKARSKKTNAIIEDSSSFNHTAQNTKSSPAINISEFSKQFNINIANDLSTVSEEQIEETTNSLMLFSASNFDSFTPETTKNIIIGDSEEKLLNTCPNLEKVENGYLLKLENSNIFYKISNGIISEIISD